MYSQFMMHGQKNIKLYVHTDVTNNATQHNTTQHNKNK